MGSKKSVESRKPTLASVSPKLMTTSSQECNINNHSGHQGSSLSMSKLKKITTSVSKSLRRHGVSVNKGALKNHKSTSFVGSNVVSQVMVNNTKIRPHSSLSRADPYGERAPRRRSTSGCQAGHPKRKSQGKKVTKSVNRANSRHSANQPAQLKASSFSQHSQNSFASKKNNRGKRSSIPKQHLMTQQPVAETAVLMKMEDQSKINLNQIETSTNRDLMMMQQMQKTPEERLQLAHEIDQGLNRIKSKMLDGRQCIDLNQILMTKPPEGLVDESLDGDVRHHDSSVLTRVSDKLVSLTDIQNDNLVQVPHLIHSERQSSQRLFNQNRDQEMGTQADNHMKDPDLVPSKLMCYEQQPVTTMEDVLGAEREQQNSKRGRGTNKSTDKQPPRKRAGRSKSKGSLPRVLTAQHSRRSKSRGKSQDKLA
jgi:hypothetical protein